MPLNFEPKESAKRNSYGCGWGKALRGVNGGSINQRFGVGIRKHCIKAPHPGIITGIRLDAHGYWQHSDRSGPDIYVLVVIETNQMPCYYI